MSSRTDRAQVIAIDSDNLAESGLSTRHGPNARATFLCRSSLSFSRLRRLYPRKKKPDITLVGQRHTKSSDAVCPRKQVEALEQASTVSEDVAHHDKEVGVIRAQTNENAQLWGLL